MPVKKEVSEPAKKVIDVLQSWYQLKRGGLTDLIAPTLDGSRPLFKKDDVNDMVRIIDKEFELELHYSRDYWRDGFGITEPPRFSELDGKARLAFVQDLWAVLQNVTIPDDVHDMVEAWRTTVPDTFQVQSTDPPSAGIQWSRGTPGTWGTPL